jgi:hypothetical protein
VIAIGGPLDGRDIELADNIDVLGGILFQGGPFDDVRYFVIDGKLVYQDPMEDM